MTHSYDDLRNVIINGERRVYSETIHMQELDHFSEKVDYSRTHRKTAREKLILKEHISRYANKNHCPIYPNN